MAESITLCLPDDLARRAREAARLDGRPLEEMLVSWLTSAAENADPTIVTPYGNEAAARIMLDMLHRADATFTIALRDG